MSSDSNIEFAKILMGSTNDASVLHSFHPEDVRSSMKTKTTYRLKINYLKKMLFITIAVVFFGDLAINIFDIYNPRNVYAGFNYSEVNYYT
jgi:hypothetical protein